MSEPIFNFVDDKLTDGLRYISATRDNIGSELDDWVVHFDYNLSQGDAPANEVIDTGQKKARDDVDDSDVNWNEYISEMGGNTRNILADIDKRERGEFLKRMRAGKSNYKEADFDWEKWLKDLFGQGQDLITNIDIDMPTPSIAGLGALGLLPAILIDGFKLLSSLLTIDEETFVEDTIKMLALQDKLKERLGEVVK